METISVRLWKNDNLSDFYYVNEHVFYRHEKSFVFFKEYIIFKKYIYNHNFICIYSDLFLKFSYIFFTEILIIFHTVVGVMVTLNRLYENTTKLKTIVYLSKIGVIIPPTLTKRGVKKPECKKRKRYETRLRLC